MRNLVITAAILASSAAVAAPDATMKKPGQMTKVTWYGQAAFKIETPSGKTILIDPWFQNPVNPTGKADVKTTKADLILVPTATTLTSSTRSISLSGPRQAVRLRSGAAFVAAATPRPVRDGDRGNSLHHQALDGESRSLRSLRPTLPRGDKAAATPAGS